MDSQSLVLLLTLAITLVQNPGSVIGTARAVKHAGRAVVHVVTLGKKGGNHRAEKSSGN